MSYFFANDNVQQGPFELAELVANGLRADSLVWTEGMPEWKPANSVPEVAALLREPASPPPPDSAPPIPIVPPMPRPMQYQTPTPQSTNGMATASMILGICALPMLAVRCVGLVSAILAIVFGHIAMGKLKRGETDQGRGKALTGLILGYVAIGIVFVLIVILLIILMVNPKLFN